MDYSAFSLEISLSSARPLPKIGCLSEMFGIFGATFPWRQNLNNSLRRRDFLLFHVHVGSLILFNAYEQLLMIVIYSIYCTIQYIITMYFCTKNIFNL